MSEDEGGPAFPVTDLGPPTRTYSGMTLRDYFAAKAMQGWLASFPADAPHPYQKDKWDNNVTRRCDEVAEIAYAFADAMLKARND